MKTNLQRKKELLENIGLPSNLQVGETVDFVVTCNDNKGAGDDSLKPIIKTDAIVKSVKFTDYGKVLYDLGINVGDSETVLNDVDSVWVKKKEKINEAKRFAQVNNIKVGSVVTIRNKKGKFNVLSFTDDNTKVWLIPQNTTSNRSRANIMDIVTVNNKVTTIVEQTLNEIGDANVKPYPFSEKKLSNKCQGYFFNTDNKINYVVYIEYDSDGAADVIFGIKGGAHVVYDITTNKGELFKVMSTIISIMKDFIHKFPEVDYITFEGNKKEESEVVSQRTKLYIMYAKKNLSSDWNIVQNGNKVVMRKRK